MAQAHASGLLSGHYVFRARYPGVCLDGTYPITLATGCELTIHSDALGNVNGSVNARSLPGPVTGTLRLVDNYLELDLHMPANNPSNKTADVFAFLHTTQFLGSVYNNDALDTFLMDVSAAEPLLVTFDLNISVNAQGQITGSGTAGNCSVTVPVTVTGSSGQSICALHIVGTNLPQFVWDGAGPSTSFGFVASWSGRGFGVSASGAQLPVFAANAPSLTPYVTSRKDHLAPSVNIPAFATWDINMPTNGTGVECRTGGALGNHQVIATFPGNVSLNPPPGVAPVRVSAGTGKVSEFLVSDNRVTVNLTGVTDAQIIAVTLAGVSDGTNMGDVVIPVGILFGDTNGDGRVDVGDTNFTKANAGPLGANSYRADVNLDGRINVGDTIMVKMQAGRALPFLPPERLKRMR